MDSFTLFHLPISIEERKPLTTSTTLSLGTYVGHQNNVPKTRNLFGPSDPCDRQ